MAPVATTIAILAALAASVAAAPKPNVVWIMSDDLGWGEPGLYPSTSPHGRIATPNLDAFGRSGMIFSDAYAGYTVCAPSRTTLMTGYHSGHFRKYSLPGTSLPVNNTIKTIAQMLKTVGYTTYASGKTAPLNEPNLQGFDYFIGQKDQGACHNMYPSVIDNGLVMGKASTVMHLPLNEKNRSRSLCMADPGAYNYTIDMFQTYGMQFLDHAASAGDPFFLYLSFTVPHAGGWLDNEAESGAPVPTDGPYASKSWPDVEKDHAGVIHYLDAYVGAVVAKLEAHGLTNNTIVFFASDNGAHLEGGHDYKFFNSTGGLLGHKRSLYEGGVRSPSMVRWPGTVPANEHSSYMWAFWDIMPTLAELSGATVPNPDIDGVSFVDTLMGKQQAPKEYVYFTWRGTGVPPMASGGSEAVAAKQASGYGIRSGDWKGVVAHCADVKNSVPSDADEMLVYNLAEDPFEAKDVAAAHPDKLAMLKQLAQSKDVSCDCFQC